MRRACVRCSADIVRRLVWFTIAGTLGFLIDASIAEGLIKLFGVNYYLARLVSFLCAVSATYVINRHYTFSDRNITRQGTRRRYLIAMASGFALNYGTYAVLGAASPFFYHYPVLAIAAGSLTGMVSNYLSSHFWVFRTASSERPPI